MFGYKRCFCFNQLRYVYRVPFLHFLCCSSFIFKMEKTGTREINKGNITHTHHVAMWKKIIAQTPVSPSVWYRYLFQVLVLFSTLFDTKFRYQYFSIPDHDTHFKNRYFSITSFRYQSQLSIPKYRYPLRYFSIPSKYLKIVQAISAKQFFIF